MIRLKILSTLFVFLGIAYAVDRQVPAGFIDFTHVTSGPTAASGHKNLYFKSSDGLLRSKNSSGTEITYSVEGTIVNASLTGSAAITNANLAAMADLRIKSNISGGSAVPADNTLSAIIDAAIGSTRGAVLYKGASGWAILSPGTSGFALTSNGAGADPSYQATSSPSAISILTKTADYTVQTSDYNSSKELVVLCNPSSASIAITMIAASNSGYRTLVKNIGSQNCVVTRAGSDTIEGDTTATISPGGVPYNAAEFISDGSAKWYVF